VREEGGGERWRWERKEREREKRGVFILLFSGFLLSLSSYKFFFVSRFHTHLGFFSDLGAQKLWRRKEEEKREA
jgi:hypothetical protein